MARWRKIINLLGCRKSRIFKNGVTQVMSRSKALDRNGLFNASSGASQSRAIDIFEGDEIDLAALKTLLRAAMDYNATHNVKKSKGSRDI